MRLTEIRVGHLADAQMPGKEIWPAMTERVGPRTYKVYSMHPFEEHLVRVNADHQVVRLPDPK